MDPGFLGGDISGQYPWHTILVASHLSTNYGAYLAILNCIYAAELCKACMHLYYLQNVEYFFAPNVGYS